MKILYLITKSNWGGAQRYVFDVAMAMRDRGHDVMVAAGGEGKLHERLKEAGIPIRSLRSAERDITLGKDIALFFEIGKLIKEWKPDLLHVNSSKMSGVGSFVGSIMGLPVVFTAHGWPFKEDVSRIAKGAMYLLSWLTSFLSQKTIVVCQEDYDLAQKMPLIGKKTALIHLGSSPFDLLPRTEARRALGEFSKGAQETRFWFGISAELHRNKGYEYLLKAFVPVDAELLCVSSGEDREKLEVLARELGIAQKVHFLGFIPEARKYMCGLDAFVLPSIKEGLPYVILEAGAAGLPIIASNVGGIPDALAHAGILVRPKDVADLQQALQTVLSDETKRLAMGCAIKQKITTEFSFDGMIAKTDELYQGLTF
jgi:glycosyltransferase involved in cell wall biosynthesis